VDTKTFLDEQMTSDNIQECANIFRWARETYPNSVFFSGVEADFEACRRNIGASMAIIDRASPYAKELKALEWALNYKRGVYELVDLNFEKAAVYFEQSLEVYVRVGRRSMVPFMAMYSFLCYHVVADHRAKVELEQDELLLEQEDSDEDAAAAPGSSGAATPPAYPTGSPTAVAEEGRCTCGVCVAAAIAPGPPEMPEIDMGQAACAGIAAKARAEARAVSMIWAGAITSPSHSTMARCMTFSSSRTLPGQSCAARRSQVSGARIGMGAPGRA
jgi:hypothetical protein